MSWGARTSCAEPFTKLLPYGLVGFAWVRKRHTPLSFAGPEGGQLSHPVLVTSFSVSAQNP